jgi:LPXTG-motif cell wall-anchored protein
MRKEKREMKILKQVTAVLIALVLVASFVPTNVFAEEESSKISVTVRVRGDSIHEDGKHEAYTTWATVKLELDQGATLADAFQAVVEQSGLEVDDSLGYISSITNSKGETLPSSYSTASAFWMYMVNGEVTYDTDDQIVLEDNDYAVYYFLDNWTESYVYDEEDEENAKNASESEDEDEDEDAAAKLQDIYEATAQLLLAGDAPGYGSTKGEWLVLGLARAGLMTDEFTKSYRETLSTTLPQKTLTATDYERVLIAITALGLEPTDIVEGVDLTEGLSDLDFILKKSLSGATYALIALDTADYEIPTAEEGATQATREALIEYILGKQNEGGFWSWTTTSTKADLDLTSMALQALAPYYDEDETVKAAVDKTLAYLSEAQDENGRIYGSWGESLESYAQFIVALTSLGIDPATDTRFIKNGTTLLDILAEYYVDGQGFKSTSSGKVNNMSTEQAFYAMVAYNRFKSGLSSLYDMTDNDEEVEEPTETPEEETETTEKSETETAEKATEETEDVEEDATEEATEESDDAEEDATEESDDAEEETTEEATEESDDAEEETTQAATTDASAPQTGDNNMATLWIALMGLSFVGMLTLQRKKSSVK